MKVYANAFRLTASGPLTIEDVFGRLVKEGILQFAHSDRDRIFAVEKTGGLFLGCVLSRRDVDSYLTLEKDAGGVPYAKRRRMDGGPSLDFTYFIISGKKRNGIFTQYQGSGGLTQFANVLSTRHRAVLEAAKETELEESGDRDELTTDARSAISKKYHGRMHAVPIPTSPDFAKELRRLAQISRFEYVTPQLKQNWIRSIRDTVKYVRHSVSFETDGPGTVNRIKKAISQMVVGDGIQEGTAWGKNSHDETDHVTIHPEHFCMADYDYNDIATDEIRLAKFSDHHVIRKLVALSTTQPNLF